MCGKRPSALHLRRGGWFAFVGAVREPPVAYLFVRPESHYRRPAIGAHVCAPYENKTAPFIHSDNHGGLSLHATRAVRRPKAGGSRTAPTIEPPKYRTPGNGDPEITKDNHRGLSLQSRRVIARPQRVKYPGGENAGRWFCLCRGRIYASRFVRKTRCGRFTNRPYGI